MFHTNTSYANWFIWELDLAQFFLHCTENSESLSSKSIFLQNCLISDIFLFVFDDDF